MTTTADDPACAEKRPSQSNTRFLAWTFIIGVGLTLFLFFYMRESERHQLKTDLENLSSDRVQAIHASLTENIAQMELMASYIGTSTELADGEMGSFATEFSKFVSSVVSGFDGEGQSLKPEFTLVAFIPAVPTEGRKRFEDIQRAQIDEAFRLRERGPAGEPIPARPRPEYFPVAILAPEAYREALLGMDLGAEPILREAMDKAMATRAVTISGTEVDPVLGRKKPELWDFVAVYRGDSPSGTKPPRSALAGILATSFRLDLLIERSLRILRPSGIDLELSDPSAPADKRTLYYHRSKASGPAVPESKKGWMSWKTSIDVGNRRWTFTAYPTPSFIARYSSIQSWLILTGGLLTTAACGLFIADRLRRTGMVESLVAERTNDLAVEISEHKRLEAELADSRSALAGQLDRLNQRSKERILISEMGDTLQVCLSIEEAYPVVALYMPRLFPGTSGALYMRDQVEGLFVSAAEWGESRPAPGAFKAEDCWALRRGKMHVVGSSLLSPTCEHAASDPEAGYLCIPLSAIGKTFGLLHIISLEEESQALGESVGDRVALALSNLMLRSDLRQLSIRDPLTGLFNRRYMEEALEIERQRAERKSASIGLIMLDIDHFKSFNDGFGHAAGDKLLRDLGGLILAHLRAGDIACRYGGEEFVLILPEASSEVAAARAEELRKRVGDLHIDVEGRSLGAISVSLGVAVYPADADSRERLLAAADACLYKAKAQGRDRVVVAGAGA